MNTQLITKAPATTINVKRGKKQTTFVERQIGLPPKELQELVNQILNRKKSKERVVVRCNRKTKKWHLFKNGLPYRELDALILIDVSFSCEWKEGEYQGCGHYADGSYSGFASGTLFPVNTPLSVPTSGVVRLRFDPEDGRFYNADTAERLKGAGYLILKEGCSSEYVTAQAIGNAPTEQNE